MKVLLISGSLPPSPCGVGDYSQQLYSSLVKKGYALKLFKIQFWNITNLLNIVADIKRESSSLLHIQYPTVGYGYSLIPQFLALVFPSVVTIHEFSQAHILRKLSLGFFTVRSSLIFTTSYERDSFCKFYFWVNKSKTSVFFLGSSIIPNQDIGQKQIADPVILSYFGLIRPNKGLEDFITLLATSQKNAQTLRGRIIGKLVQGQAQYATQLKLATADLPIEWCLDQSEEAVSDLLFETTFTYLPYPDGASMRRTSLLAALFHGTFVITTKGAQTPVGLDDVVLYADSPAKALVTITEFDYSTLKVDILARNTTLFLLPYHWEKIAENHINLYESIIGKRNLTLAFQS